jgi:gluconokinase
LSPGRQRLTTIVVMGVSGVGKSSVMAALAERLGWPTLEGDALHPPTNIEKMAAGVPLDDADRAPWLARIAAWIGDREAERSSAIVTCSALRRAYRDVLRSGHPSVWFIHLVAARDVIATRIEHREGHFMPGAMLGSQLEALELLEPDEPGWAVEALAPPDDIAERVIAHLRLDPG